ncbi:MAG: hypothetical protein ACLFQM_04655 [Fidelibacterota bacterium]
MRWKKIVVLILVLIGLFAYQGYNMEKENQVDISVMEYKGWEEAIEIDNHHLRMVIVPSISRIMFFGFSGGDNLMWNNEKFLGKNIEYTEEMLKKSVWANYGGDKVWTVEQKDFPKTIKRGWPPDETFDGGNFDYELLENGVKIISEVSPYSHTRLVREITTEPNAKKFKIAQTVICEGENSVVPVTIWNVSQVLPPEKFVVDYNKNSKFKGGIKYFLDEFEPTMELIDNKMIIDNVRDDTLKIGTDSKRFLSAVWKDKIFTQSFHYIDGETYPDDGCPVEVFISTKFVEMELLSHLKMLQKGETLSFDIEWTLDNLPKFRSKEIVDIINKSIKE